MLIFTGMSDDAAALALRSTVREMVAAFELGEARTRAAFAALVETELRLNAVYAPAGDRRSIRIDATTGGHGDDFANIERAIGRMRREAWKCIAAKLELHRVVSQSRAATMDKELDEGELPPITDENVVAFVERHQAALGVLFAEAVRETFAWIRPYERSAGAALRTNQKNATLELGPKIILTGVVRRKNIGPGFEVTYSSSPYFNALEKVFRNLSGQGDRIRGHHSDLENAIGVSGTAGVGETEFFRFKCFRNGNLHLEFLQLEHLATFNRIAGGLNLKPPQVVRDPS